MREQFGEKVTLTGSKVKQIATIRNQSIAAGQFYTVATALASDGVKKINTVFGSPDTFLSNFYFMHKGADNQLLQSLGAADSSKSAGNMSSELYSGMIVIIFKNSDSVAHNINCDVLGFYI